MAGLPFGLNRKRVLTIAGALFLILLMYLTLNSGVLQNGPTRFKSSNVVVPQDKVRESVERLIEENPGFAQGCRLMAQLENAAGNVANEARWINQAIALEGDYLQGLFRLGKTWADLGELDRAMEMVERGQALEAADPDMGYLLATVLFLRGQGEKASEVYRDLLEQHPDHLDLLANAAHHEVMLGNYAEAKVLLLRYMGLDQEPQNWSVDRAGWFGAGLLAHVFAQEGDARSAGQLGAAVLQMAAAQSDRSPQSFYPYRRTAWAFAVLGMAPAAIENLSIAVDRGYWGYWEFEYDPVWDDLRADTRFQTLHSRMKERRAALLIELESIS